MQTPQSPIPAQAWARLRFAVIGPLLSSPPPRGQLAAEIKRLAAKTWQHPTTGEPVMFGASTIEAWFYKARNHPADPVKALRRAVRSDAGTHSINPDLITALRNQYTAYPTWSYLLHMKNLKALVKEEPKLGPMRSYATIRRYMTSHGMRKRKKPQRGPERHVEVSWEDREKRSFEAAYVGSLWHLDFHHCSRKVLAPNGQWYKPIALGVHDDRSRLACHVQWYLSETTEDLVHGLCQAFQKYGLPRAIQTDNGSAMKADEFVQGLERLGIDHDTTLPRSPWQNGKEENFWGPLEGRLIAMLSRVHDLTLKDLNRYTQAWVEVDYNREPHSEIGQKPLERYATDEHVLRTCPSSEELREAFRLESTRTQRHSDGTVSIEGVRFEIPGRLRHVKRLTVRYARWNLQLIHLVDVTTDTLLCRVYPLDKEANADGRRRRIEPTAADEAIEAAELPADEIPPYLREIVSRYADTGKPPGYIAKPTTDRRDAADDQDEEVRV